MKTWLKVTICVIVFIFVLVVIDMVSIYTKFKPVFAVKKSCDECTNDVYYGLFYDTYVCNQYTVPQVKAKWTKYSCVDLPQDKTFEIIDTTEICAEALEGIYKDSTGEYFLPCIKSQNISIKFNDGTTYSLKYVLDNNILTIQELIDGGLEVYRY